MFAQYFKKHGDQKTGPDHLETQRDCDESLAEILEQEQDFDYDDCPSLKQIVST